MNNLENTLVRIDNEQAVTSSKHIAKYFEKRHADVLRDIKNLATQNCATKNYFYETTHMNRGKEYPMYLINKKGFMLLVMGFNGAKAIEMKMKFLDRFEQMEDELRNKNQIALPSNYKEALIALVEAEEVKEQLQLEIEVKDELLIEQAPKVELADAITSDETSILVRDMAKILKQNLINVGEKRLFTWMRNNGYLLANNFPSQKSMDLGVLEYNSYRTNAGVKFTPKVTGKGIEYFLNKFLKGMAM